MPVDDNGFRADIIMTPASVINRMNPSQLYEQFWNRVSAQVVINSANMSWKDAWTYIVDYLNDYRPVYAQEVINTHPTDRDKEMFVQDCRERGIYLCSGFTKNFTEQLIIDIAKKYGVEETPVTYKVINKKTGQYDTIRTKSNVFIGNKFFMLLGKIPASMIHSVELAYVSQFDTPIKPTSKYVKSQSSMGQTPQRFGEDEICMMNMSLLGDTVARIMCTCSASSDVVKQLATEMLTCERPTALSFLNITTQKAIEKNKNISIFTHLMGAIGYDVRPEEVSNPKGV